MHLSICKCKNVTGSQEFLCVCIRLYGSQTLCLQLQELLSLAEACAIPNLCKVLVSLVEVDEENVKMWLCWLEQERTGDVKLILSQCSEVLQKKFQRLSQWALLSPEELSQLCKIGEHLHSASLKPYTNLNEGQVSVKLITEWDIKQRIGKSGIFDLVNFDKIEGCRMDGGTSFANFKVGHRCPTLLQNSFVCSKILLRCQFEI